MLAVGVLAVAILSLLALFGSGLRLMDQANDVSRATEVARSVVEATKLLGYDGIPDGTVTFDGKNGDVAAGGFPPEPYPSITLDGVEYFVIASTQPVEDTLKSVRVEVVWGARGRLSVETAVHP